MTRHDRRWEWEVTQMASARFLRAPLMSRNGADTEIVVLVLSLRTRWTLARHTRHAANALLNAEYQTSMTLYEFRPSAATGCFRHGVSLHTSIVVKVDRGPHDSFLQPNRVHRHVSVSLRFFYVLGLSSSDVILGVNRAPIFT